MGRQGFMLLELVLVCCLIGILACCMSFSFRVFDELRVRLACNQLYLMFLSLQQEACVKGKEIEFVFLPQQNAYRVTGRPTHYLPDSVVFKAPFSRAITFQHARAVFYPSGHTDAGSVYLSNKESSCYYRISTTIAQHTYINRAVYKDGKWVDL